MFMRRVGAVANRTQTIQRRDAERGSEVSIRAAADCRLFELPANFARQLLSFAEECGGTCAAFHRRAIEASRNFQLALAIDRLERAHLAIDLGGIAQAFHANINVGAGFGGNHVGAGASANDADVQGQSSLRFPKRCDTRDLVRQLDNGALAFEGIEPRMRGLAGNADGIFSNPFAGGLQRALGPGGWF